MKGDILNMDEKEIMLKIENVSKVYKLGEIGGTTLRETFQRLWAKIRHKEDPTKKIGAKNYNKGERFKALDNISFEVRKGERIGIIGHNGAGKSTLLKLISRVTGPTEGKIYLNGRVASMLEVGTGFNPELTGRENIYMNGAILGMTKKEIDSKIEDIIEFSEVRQFIDTPVKRYSSGMYVKLAFSVAAHLDSEIMIMDEVLAVGDMAFQNKCLNKMKEVSEQDDRTILYVSHNMNTIRQLCQRVIVLNKGQIVFDGNVEEGVATYLGIGMPKLSYDFNNYEHEAWKNENVTIKSIEVVGKTSPMFDSGEYINAEICIEANKPFNSTKLRFEVLAQNDSIVGTALSNCFSLEEGINLIAFKLNTSQFVYGRYSINVLIFEFECNRGHALDGVYPGIVIDISNTFNDNYSLSWKHGDWGYIHLPDAEVTLK